MTLKYLYSYNRFGQNIKLLLSSRKYHYYRRPMGDLDMLHRRHQHYSLETDMPDWRPRHASSETHLKPTCPIVDQHTCLIRDIYVCKKSDCTPQACWSPMSLHRYVSLWWGMSVTAGACRSRMGLQSGMSVSDEACQGLWWVFDQACRYPMKHVKVSNKSPMKHVEVSDGCQMGLQK